MSGASTPPSGSIGEKMDEKPQHVEQIETVKTNESDKAHPLAHDKEKNGLRTYGDDEDHEHEPKVWFNSLTTLNCH